MPPVAPPLAAVEALDVPLAVLGLLLIAGALVAGLARRSLLSLTALFVIAGLLLGDAGLGVLEVDPTGDFVANLAVVALIVILFRDGLEVEAELLQTAWHLPLRKLALAMPMTAALVACAAKALTDRPGPRRSCSARCCRRPTPCCRRRSSPIRACRASSATRSTSSRA